MNDSMANGSVELGIQLEGLECYYSFLCGPQFSFLQVGYNYALLADDDWGAFSTRKLCWFAHPESTSRGLASRG